MTHNRNLGKLALCELNWTQQLVVCQVIQCEIVYLLRFYVCFHQLHQLRYEGFRFMSALLVLHSSSSS